MNTEPNTKISARSIFSAVLVLAIIYMVYQVTFISRKVAAINISDDKMEYVYNKVGNLVDILNTKEDMSVDYNPTEQYQFKASDKELTAEEPATAKENREALKEELSKMKDGDKLKLVRDKLVDIYQKSKTRDDELLKLKQSFYETKSSVESWYNDKKNIKSGTAVVASTTDKAGIFNRLKDNLGKFVEVSKVPTEDMKGGKKILTVDQIPELLSYAEMMIEAGSLPQAAWIMEDVQTITKQEEIFSFTSKVEVFNEKFPNANAEVQEIKELIDIIENQG